jgi:hypothetical protein
LVFLVIAPILYSSFKYIVIYWIYHIIYILTGGTTTLGGSTTGFVTTGWVVVTTGDFIGDVDYDTCCIIT